MQTVFMYLILCIFGFSLMARFNEDTFTRWTYPPSESEETKLSNAERMIREAIRNDKKLSGFSVKVFGQGSYANDTNVRLNSDIDINVCYEDGFYFDLPANKSREDYGLGTTAYTFEEFKSDVHSAIINAFGANDVTRNDKCITVEGNTYRVKTDVVPTWRHRRYNLAGGFIEGVFFFSDAGVFKKSYPEEHIINARTKNANTSKRYKRTTRIFRKLRYRMIEEGEPVSDNITSFLIESLLFNVPDHIYNDHDSWSERVKQSIIYLYNNTLSEEKCKEWGEVSELLYLFIGRKWSRTDANNYMQQLWNYLQF